VIVQRVTRRKAAGHKPKAEADGNRTRPPGIARRTGFEVLSGPSGPNSWDRLVWQKTRSRGVKCSAASFRNVSRRPEWVRKWLAELGLEELEVVMAEWEGFHYHLQETGEEGPPEVLQDIGIFTTLEDAREAASSLGRRVDIYRTRPQRVSEHVETYDPQSNS
jgi:hypothetical protein